MKCPVWRGVPSKFTLRGIFETQQSVLNTEVFLFQGCLKLHVPYNQFEDVLVSLYLLYGIVVLGGRGNP